MRDYVMTGAFSYSLVTKLWLFRVVDPDGTFMLMSPIR